MSSPDPRATEAKADGTNAWSVGNYDLAIEHFSTAITFGGDKEFLKVLHSNRSAAYLKVNKIEEALKDGNKCVELDSNWPKGFTRKGDALLAKKSYNDAYNAYNSALRLTPGDASLTTKLEQAMRGMRNASQPSSSSSSAGSTSSTTSSVPNTGIFYYAKLAVLILSVVYLLPLGKAISFYSYKIAAGLFAALSLYGIYTKFGFPQFTSAYGQRVIPDPLTLQVFLGVFNLASKPYMFAIAPVFLNVLTSFTPQLLQFLKANLSLVQEKVQPLLQRFMPSMAGQDMTRILGSLSATQLNLQLLKSAATCEVYQGLFLIFELILPTRNVMQVFLWWQYLQMRYMMDSSNNLKGAFAALDVKLSALLNHRLCPAVVRQGYATLKTFLAKQVAVPTRGAEEEQGGGMMGNVSKMMSKCSIM